jgi:hypothetical protein
MLCQHSCVIKKDKPASKDRQLKQISGELRQFLIEDIILIMTNHIEICISRDRKVGLDDSTCKLEKLLKYYEDLKKLSIIKN